MEVAGFGEGGEGFVDAGYGELVALDVKVGDCVPDELDGCVVSLVFVFPPSLCCS